MASGQALTSPAVPCWSCTSIQPYKSRIFARGQLDRVPVGDAEIDLSKSEIKQFGSENDILIRVTESGEGTEVADGIMAVLESGFAASIAEMEWIRRQEKVGPKIGSELSSAAVRAVLVALALILLYMAWRFHRFLYGIAAVVALFHDVLITLGLLSLFDIEITLAVVAALLAIVGYSLNDTIVVFDRIRENLHTARRQGFDGTVNQSINECLSRTLITSATTLLAVLVLMIFGGEVNRDFTITLMIGVVVGTYSSIFVASPVALPRPTAGRRKRGRLKPAACGGIASRHENDSSSCLCPALDLLRAAAGSLQPL